jgi:hypothetical protein
MVAVDADGNITINGSSNFKVFKNGRPNNSFTKNAKDILAAIPASMIKTIEVITEPGAKYDAEGIGAILNIVTLDNTVIKGILGSARLEYDPYQRRYSGSCWFTSQVDKVTFSLSTGINRMSDKQSKSYTDRTEIYNSGIVDKFSQSISNSGYVGWLNGEGSWDLNKYNLFTLEMQGYYFNVKPNGTSFSQRYGADGLLSDSYKSIIAYPKYAYLDFNGNFNYQLSTDRSGESLTASYAVSTTETSINFCLLTMCRAICLATLTFKVKVTSILSNILSKSTGLDLLLKYTLLMLAVNTFYVATSLITTLSTPVG